MGFIFQRKFYDRPPTIEDIGEITRLFNLYWEPQLGMPKFSETDIRSGLTAPGFDMQSSARLILSRRDKHIVGFILLIDHISPVRQVFVQGCVHPAYEGQGIGTFLLHWAENRAGQSLVRVPPGIRLSIKLTALSTHEPTRHLFQKMKYKALRHSYIMVVKLDDSLIQANLPGGIAISTYQDHPELASIYRAADEAFQDHWGYTSADEAEGIKQWQHRQENDPDFDPSLWFLAMDKDEIAAIALCNPNTGPDREMGYVTLLGVRRPWRRQGLALALLNHVFSEFRRRGLKYAGLNVDAESLTGANRVYEKAGMKVVRDILSYEKELCPPAS